MAKPFEGDFELLPRPARRSGRARWVVPVLALAASLSWLAYESVRYWQVRQAIHVAEQAAHDRVAAIPAGSSSAPTAMPSELAAQPSQVYRPPPYYAEAAAAAKLLQAPVDEWLRALEHCQPSGSRTTELHIDVARAEVTTTVEVGSRTDTTVWIKCLNEGQDTAPWRLVQMNAMAEDMQPRPTEPSRWRVLLRRRDQ